MHLSLISIHTNKCIQLPSAVLKSLQKQLFFLIKKKIKKLYPLKAKRGRKAFKKKKTTEEKTNSLILKNKRTNPVFIFLLTIAENEYKGP